MLRRLSCGMPASVSMCHRFLSTFSALHPTRSPSLGGPRRVVPYDIGSNRSTSSGSIVGAIFFSLAASTIVAGSSSFFSALDVIQPLFQIVASSPATNLQTGSAQPAFGSSG